MFEALARVDIVAVRHGIGNKSNKPYAMLDVVPTEAPAEARRWIEPTTVFADPTLIPEGSVATPMVAQLRLQVRDDGRVQAIEVRPVTPKGATA